MPVTKTRFPVSLMTGISRTISDAAVASACAPVGFSRPTSPPTDCQTAQSNDKGLRDRGVCPTLGAGQRRSFGLGWHSRGVSQTMKQIAVLFLSAWMLALPARADDSSSERLDNWPHWRGPETNGMAPRGDPPVTWDEKKNIKWKAPLAGRGSSTPIVWGDRVFVTTAIKTDRVAEASDLPKLDPRFEKKTTAPTNYYQFVVLCFDRTTGDLCCKQTATEHIAHEAHQPTNSYAAGPPPRHGKRLSVSLRS